MWRTSRSAASARFRSVRSSTKQRRSNFSFKIVAPIKTGIRLPSLRMYLFSNVRHVPRDNSSASARRLISHLGGVISGQRTRPPRGLPACSRPSQEIRYSLPESSRSAVITPMMFASTSLRSFLAFFDHLLRTPPLGDIGKHAQRARQPAVLIVQWSGQSRRRFTPSRRRNRNSKISLMPSWPRKALPGDRLISGKTTSKTPMVCISSTVYPSIDAIRAFANVVCLRVDDPDALGGSLDDAAVILLTATQRLLGFFLRREIRIARRSPQSSHRASVSLRRTRTRGRCCRLSGTPETRLPVAGETDHCHDSRRLPPPRQAGTVTSPIFLPITSAASTDTWPSAAGFQ